MGKRSRKRKRRQNEADTAEPYYEIVTEWISSNGNITMKLARDTIVAIKEMDNDHRHSFVVTWSQFCLDNPVRRIIFGKIIRAIAVSWPKGEEQSLQQQLGSFRAKIMSLIINNDPPLQQSVLLGYERELNIFLFRTR